MSKAHVVVARYLEETLPRTVVARYLEKVGQTSQIEEEPKKEEESSK
jgi:hypothetical protein